MATATKQLEAIFQEITRQFSGNTVITVTPIDGDPPEKYEVTYHITGVYKDSSGEIQERSNHIITISIPFGFPHFPPSCKPKTEIFHPDFDPAAICIGDFWDKDRTIGDLIVHIAHMIAGHIFSTSNAFNEEAAKWYKDHGSRLPFDDRDVFESGAAVLDSAAEQPDTDDVTLLLENDEEDENDILRLDDIVEDLTEQTPKEDRVPPPSLRDEEPPADVDTLDESFLKTDFDYFEAPASDPATDEILPPSVEEAEESTFPSFDTDRLKLLAKQKRFFELSSQLTDLPSGHDFDGRSRLAEQASTALQQARDLYNQGTDFEHQGDPGKAWEVFKRVDQLVSDYPGLHEDIERTAQAKELLGDWYEPSSDSSADEGLADAPTTASPTADEFDEPRPKRETRTFFEETARQTSRIIPYAIGIVFLIAAIAVGSSYYLNTSRLSNARMVFDDCQALLQQNRFTEAERQCESALANAKQVQFFRSGSRDQLIAQIETVLKSEQLHQGLAGNLLYEGRYLPRQAVKAMQAFNHFTKEGDGYFANQNWEQAQANYTQALELAAKEQDIDRELVFSVSERQKQARFNSLSRSGEEFIKREKWVLATEDLEQALALAKDLNIENKAEVVDTLTAKLAEIAAVTAKEQGDQAFAAANWEQALHYYKQAHAVAGTTTRPGDQQIEELKQLMLQAELYETINTGKIAFTEADWDQAISNYERAIMLLESNSDLLKQSSTEANKRKLARTMLQAAVVRDKQEAARHLRDQNYQIAIEKLRSIKATVERSEFSGEPEFRAVLNETEQAVRQAETDRLLADKIAYLEKNFKELFTKHYTASPPESLIDPNVIYERRLGDRLLFRLECTEIGRGRPLKLVMKYTHNLTTGEWQFYSGND